MRNYLDNFPNLKETKNLIENLKNVSWPKVSDFKNFENYITLIEKEIFKGFEIIPNLKRNVKCSDFKLPIFRVRELNTFSNVDLFCEHSYPPINITIFGRCNFPANPVFYCSNNPMVALLEVIKKSEYKRRKFCISKWEIIDLNEKLIVESFVHSDLHNENHLKILKENEIEKLNESFKYDFDKDKSEAILDFFKFLHTTFLNDDNYNLSAALAHRTLFAKHNLSTNILLYPSVQSSFEGLNMAINPNFVDNMMRVERLYIVELESFDIESGKFNLTFFEVGNLHNNIIFWKNFNPNDEVHKKCVKNDFNNILLA